MIKYYLPFLLAGLVSTNAKKTGETNVNPLKKILSNDRVSKSFGD